MISARFGGGNNWADVTKKVQQLFAEGKAFYVNPGTLGVDPTPGWRKHLQIEYVQDGQNHSTNTDEDAAL